MAADVAGERAKALELAIAQIEKHFGKGSIVKLGADTPGLQKDAIPSGSLGLDKALGVGGIPRGRIIEVYGPESSGKTTLTLSILGQAQKRGGTAVFIDAEHALQPSYAKLIGVDIAKRRWRSPTSSCAAGRSTSWRSTRSPRWFPAPRSRARWGTPTSGCRRV
jgi:protein RecA